MEKAILKINKINVIDHLNSQRTSITSAGSSTQVLVRTVEKKGPHQKECEQPESVWVSQQHPLPPFKALLLGLRGPPRGSQPGIPPGAALGAGAT